MPGDPLLDYLERTFADAYRKEVDAEENVWRSLPFFAATLALQLAALAQIKEWLAGQVGGGFLLASDVLLVVIMAATSAALVLLAGSVWPANVERVMPEPDMLVYVERIGDDLRGEGAGLDEQEIARRAMAALKRTLTGQYADAALRTRIVNRRRTKWRTLAGLATLCSVAAMLALVALVVVSNLHGYV